jgi:hypothetical protein
MEMESDRFNSATSVRARSLSSAFAWPNLDPIIAQRLRPMLVLALLYFKSPLDVNLVRDLMQKRLVYKHFRFRAVPRREGLAVHLDALHPSAIDMEHHIRELPEAAGWGQREIDTFVSREYAASKDPTKPLWIFYVLNNLADGRSCLLVNIDHSIGDGIALIQVDACTAHILTQNSPHHMHYYLLSKIDFALSSRPRGFHYA